MMKNKSNFPNKNVGSALNKLTKKKNPKFPSLDVRAAAFQTRGCLSERGSDEFKLVTVRI